MNIQELRIGNWANFTFYGLTEQFQVHSIEEKMIGSAPNIKYELHMVSGIPLTEEWLLKAGFYDSSKGYSLISIGESQHLAVILYNNDGVLEPYVELHSFDRRYNIGLKSYVHHLQNLYFALTGTELTFNH